MEKSEKEVFSSLSTLVCQVVVMYLTNKEAPTVLWSVVKHAGSG